MEIHQVDQEFNFLGQGLLRNQVSDLLQRGAVWRKAENTWQRGRDSVGETTQRHPLLMQRQTELT